MNYCENIQIKMYKTKRPDFASLEGWGKQNQANKIYFIRCI